MDTILALREKRKNLWDAAKNFLDTVRDENGMVSAEDAARYDKMEADVVNLGKEIDRLERQQQLDAQLAQPTRSRLLNSPGAGQNGAEKKGRASDAYRKAFWDSIRHKNFIDVQNALSVGTDADGGYLVPDEFEHQLIDKLQEENFLPQPGHGHPYQRRPQDSHRDGTWRSVLDGRERPLPGQPGYLRPAVHRGVQAGDGYPCVGRTAERQRFRPGKLHCR
jgi:hypothetical protein